MIWIIIIIVAVLVIRFAVATNSQAEQVAKQGGMKNKYRTLISYILDSHPKAKIFQEKSSFISVGAQSLGGSTVFFITQSFGMVVIEYKVQSPIFGEHKLKWEFPEFMDQNKMIEKMNYEIGEYTKNIITANM